MKFVFLLKWIFFASGRSTAQVVEHIVFHFFMFKICVKITMVNVFLCFPKTSVFSHMFGANRTLEKDCVFSS